MNKKPAIRIGVEGGRANILARVASMGAPVMVSANSMWSQARQRFSGWEKYRGLDVALDSGGFVAMIRYGGYRWTVEQYCNLSLQMKPTWWAQMDFCCEPQIAGNRSAVYKRITQTAEHLEACRATSLNVGAIPPMPVLQGWEPADYCMGPIYESNEWPSLVGIGSVCRRNIGGRNGVVAVVDALNKVVPYHVRFHLFGVKSGALSRLTEFFPDRIASVDSMAWSLAARWDCIHAGIACDNHQREMAMVDWYEKQVNQPVSPQLHLPL